MKKILQKYDICVVGAGFAGFAAAVKSARQGAAVLLVDRSPGWGGVTTSGRHQHICGLYAQTATFPVETLNAGLAREVESYIKTEGAVLAQKVGKVYVLPYAEDLLQRYFNSEVKKYRHLDIVFDAQIESVTAVKELIDHVTISTKNEFVTISCGALIDASGSAEAVRLSGASYDIAPVDERQLAAYVIKIAQVKKLSDMQKMEIFYHLAQAVEQALLPNHLRYGTWLQKANSDEGFLRLSVLPSDTAYAVKDIRKQADEVFTILKREMPVFESAVVESYASIVVEREGARMIGKYTLNEEDILTGKKFPGKGVKGSWPIEFWDQKKGPQYDYLKDLTYYEIPSECLVSKDYENLFAAGRCISVTSRAMASTRVTGTCLALGEMAADLAVLFVRETAGKPSKIGEVV